MVPLGRGGRCGPGTLIFVAFGGQVRKLLAVLCDGHFESAFGIREIVSRLLSLDAMYVCVE